MGMKLCLQGAPVPRLYFPFVFLTLPFLSVSPSFQRKVEKFHEGQVEINLTADSYVSRTIALVNCCPPFRCVPTPPLLNDRAGAPAPPQKTWPLPNSSADIFPSLLKSVCEHSVPSPRLSQWLSGPGPRRHERASDLAAESGDLPAWGEPGDWHPFWPTRACFEAQVPARWLYPNVATSGQPFVGSTGCGEADPQPARFSLCPERNRCVEAC